MTTLREAAQLALEALEESEQHYGSDSALRDAMQILRAALEQPEQESGWKLSCGCPSQYGGIPAEWPDTDREGNVATAYGVICEKHWHAYEAQHPRREWRGLSKDETMHLMNDTSGGEGWADEAHIQRLRRSIEAKLKEKNT
jgi:hypothetical protein